MNLGCVIPAHYIPHASFDSGVGATLHHLLMCKMHYQILMNKFHSVGCRPTIDMAMVSTSKRTTTVAWKSAGATTAQEGKRRMTRTGSSTSRTPPGGSDDDGDMRGFNSLCCVKCSQDVRAIQFLAMIVQD